MTIFGPRGDEVEKYIQQYHCCREKSLNFNGGFSKNFKIGLCKAGVRYQLRSSLISSSVSRLFRSCLRRSPFCLRSCFLRSTPRRALVIERSHSEKVRRCLLELLRKSCRRSTPLRLSLLLRRLCVFWRRSWGYGILGGLVMSHITLFFICLFLIGAGAFTGSTVCIRVAFIVPAIFRDFIGQEFTFCQPKYKTRS